MEASKTIGLVQVYMPFGKCTNTEPINGLTVCKGACDSGTALNSQTRQQEQICTCCSVEERDSLKVPIDCENGWRQTVDIEIPKTCSCQTCNLKKTTERGTNLLPWNLMNQRFNVVMYRRSNK